MAALIDDQQAIIENLLYMISCRDLDEAYYLLAIINSLTLEGAVRDFRSTGQFGARHVHKHLWKLPIPEYDSSNESHAGLSRLVETAAEECELLLAELVVLNGDDWLTVEHARSSLRHGWQPGSVTGQAIGSAVEKLLTEN